MDGTLTKRFGWRSGAHGIRLFMLCVLAFGVLFSAAPASAETRSLKLYFLHTGERAEITFKKNGKYVQGGLKKINRFLRDWRRNEPTKMDPRLLDLVWEIYKETGSKKHIHVISAYRSPATNNLLRKRGRGVAKTSQHTLGKAMDFFIPGVSLRKLRNIGLKKGLGGVGYYPKSGSPFVHMDTGRVRHWPRMSRKELVRVFPKGKTLHVPTDGKPLARYNQAKAEYERKVSGRGRIVVAKAEEIKKKPNVFARLLGRGEDDDEGASGAVSAPKAVATTRQPAPAPTPQTPTLPAPAPAPAILAPTPAEGLAEPKPEETPATILASLPSSALPIPVIAPRVVAAEVTTAELDQTDGVQNPEAIETVTAETVIAETEETTETELALDVPVPARRPAFEPEVQIAEAAPETPQTVQTASSALSANEIADLRQQVYAALKADHQNQQSIAATPATLDSARIEVASANIDGLQNDSNALGIGVPQRSPRNAAGNAISAQLQTQETTPTPPEVEVATLEALKPIDPQLTSGAGISVPQPNPIQKPDEAEAPEATVVAGIAIPSRALRPQAKTQTPSPTIETQIASSQTKKDGELAQFKTANLDTRLVGKWALAANTSISEIADIRPPAYGRNVIRETPDTVLSRGFSQETIADFTQGFSGSSIEFLDFKRFGD